MKFPEIKKFTPETRIEGKAGAIKVLEEAAELTEAVKDYLKLKKRPIQFQISSMEVYERNHILEEFGDVLQTLANIADILDISEEEIQKGYDFVVSKNTERGKHVYAN